MSGPAFFHYVYASQQEELVSGGLEVKECRHELSVELAVSQSLAYCTAGLWLTIAFNKAERRVH